MAEVLHKITAEELMKLNSDKSSFVLLAFSYLHDHDVAEDIFQESILYILENRDTISVNNARWYFSRVILNKCLYYLRQSSNRARIKDSIRDSVIMAENIKILSDKASDEAAFNADLSGCLEECRRELPQLAYNIFIDAKVRGLSHKDIAEAYNITQRRVATEMTCPGRFQTCVQGLLVLVYRGFLWGKITSTYECTIHFRLSVFFEPLGKQGDVF